MKITLKYLEELNVAGEAIQYYKDKGLIGKEAGVVVKFLADDDNFYYANWQAVRLLSLRNLIKYTAKAANLVKDYDSYNADHAIEEAHNMKGYNIYNDDLDLIPNRKISNIAIECAGAAACVTANVGEQLIDFAITLLSQQK